MQRFKRGLWFVLCLFCLLMVPGIAQQQEGIDVSQIDLESLLNVTVVSASRFPQELMEAPSAISIITEKDIRNAPAHNIVELIQYVVGMDGFTKTHSDMDVAARGFAFDESPKMLVLIDGQVVNSVPTSGTNWPQIPVDLSEIDRIEIVRGSASSVYGADALVGVINIILKKTANRRIAASLLYGELGTIFGNVNLAKQFSKSFGLSVRGGYVLTEKQGNAETPDAVNAAPNYGIKDWAQIYNGSYRLDFSGEKISFVSEGGYSQDEDGYNPSPGDRTIDQSFKKTIYVNNMFTAQFGKDLLNVRFGLRNNWQKNNKWVTDHYEYKYTVKKGIGVDIDASYTLMRLANNIFVIGANFGYVRASREIPNPESNYVYDATENLYSIYVQEQQKLFNNNFTISLGGRYDKWKSLSGVLSPKVAVNIALFKKKANLRLNFGSSFRRPAFDENYYLVVWPGGWFKGSDLTRTTNDGREIAGALLKPEKLTAYEGGLRLKLSESMMIDTGYFYHKVKDLIGYQVYYVGPNPGEINLGLENLADTLTVQGAEFELKKYFGVDFYVFLNYTYQSAEMKFASGATQPWENVPQHKISGGIRYTGSFNVDLRARYVTKVKYQEISSIQVDDYSTIDAAVSKDIKNRFFFKVAVLNLLNDQHYEYPIYTKMIRKAMLTVEFHL